MHHPHDPTFDPLYHETTRKLKWLVFARWVGVAGQILTALLAHQLLGIEFNVWGLSVCLGFVFLSNAWIHWKMADMGTFTRAVIATVLVLDSLILTVTLHGSGGAHNPFTSFYLLHVTLAAVLLPGVYALGISALSVAGFVWLYVTAQSCCGDSIAVGLLSAGISQDMHFQGMVVSLALTAVFISVFVGKIQWELSRSHRMLREARVDLEKQERFHSLATLAAGVAHELATPLGTIALVSKEIEGEELSGRKHEELLDDVRMIRAEVERCRAIIDRLNVENLTVDANPVNLSVGALLDDFQPLLPAETSARTRIEITPETAELIVRLPRMLFFTSLQALLKNACESDDSGSPIRCRFEHEGAVLRLSVIDHGTGVEPEKLGRLGEPFYTTKGPHEGMGLGLFLVRMFAEKSGGSLRFISPVEQGKGLCSILEFPLVFQNSSNRAAP